MKAESGHIVFKGRFRWRSLSGCFEELLRTYLEETDQVPDEEDIFQMFLRINLMDIEKNRKPEGFNRRGRLRMVFPNTPSRKEFYIRAETKTSEVVRVTEKLSRLLKKASVPHSIEWDKLQHLEQM